MRTIKEDKGRVRPVVEDDFQCDENGNSTRIYEVLSLVGYAKADGTKLGYISKTNVPIGIPITDTKYWYPFQVIGVPKGDKGDRGDDGKSAYDLYIEHGGTITPVEAWIASLQGKDGRNGRDGKDGKDGKDGRPLQLRISSDGQSIEISSDGGETWHIFEKNFSKLRVLGYIDSISDLPRNANIGDIYGVRISDEEIEEEYTYNLYINTVIGWNLDYTITKVYDYDTELPSSAANGTTALVPVDYLTLDKEKIDGYKVYRFSIEKNGWVLILDTAEIYASKEDIINHGDNVYALVQGDEEHTYKLYKRVVGWVYFGTNASITYVLVQDINEGTETNILSGKAVTDAYGRYIESPEFMRAYLDGEDKILWGIRTDGTIYFGAGVPPQVKDYIEKRSEDIVAFLDDLEKGDKTLQDLLDEKVDKEEGKSLIDEEYAEGVNYIDNSDFVDVKLDSKNKIICGIKKDGTFCVVDISFIGSSNKIKQVLDCFGIVDSSDFISVELDADNKIISCRRIDGTLVEYAGIYTTSLKLSKEGLSNFARDLSEVLNNTKLTQITIKKDGSGDFTNIQDAINSINDASEYNQYELLVYDDFVSNSFSDLRYFDNPSIHVESVNSINSAVGLVYTKSWVHITGVGGQKKIWFINPDVNTPSDKFQYIHSLYGCGNCKFTNLDIRIKGGRYAIHQDRSGDTSASNPDVDSTTEYVNSHIEHFGNEEYTYGSSWGTSAGLAACCSSGQTIKVINCYIKATTDPIVSHLHKEYKKGTTAIFERVTAICTNPELSPDSIGSYYTEFGSGVDNELIIIGCNFHNLRGGVTQTNLLQRTSPDYKRSGKYIVSGYGNRKMYLQAQLDCSWFISANIAGTDVVSVSGSAADLLFGPTKNIPADNSNGGILIGTYRCDIIPGVINGQYNSSWSLAYRLGNCATNPKVLNVVIGSQEYTITFNKNYMTTNGEPYTSYTEPAIDGRSIMNDINSVIGDVAVFGNTHEVGLYGLHNQFIKLYSFSDCIEHAVNRTNVRWKPLQCLVRDYSSISGWRLANANEVPDAICGETILGVVDGKYSEGVVILVDKVIFGCSDYMKYLNNGSPKGTKLKVGNDSYLTPTQDVNAPFEIITENGTFIKL